MATPAEIQAIIDTNIPDIGGNGYRSLQILRSHHISGTRDAHYVQGTGFSATLNRVGGRARWIITDSTDLAENQAAILLSDLRTGFSSFT